MSLKELIRLHVRTFFSGIRDARTILNVGLVVLVTFLFVNYAYATTPNPGHPWTDVGDGVFSFTSGQTATPYTYTFPAANSTVLTTNAAVTAPQGGTGQGTYAIGDILYASATNALSRLADVAVGSYLRSGGANTAPVWSTPTLPNTAANLKVMMGNGTNWVESTPAYPNAAVTAGKVIVSDGTNYIASTPTFPNASATTRKIIVSDGTNWVASTETYAVPGATAGNVLMSNGTNWASTVAGGIFVGKRYLTTGTSYTPTAGVTKVFLQIVGGGGGGGGVTAVASGAGGGGGAGGYTEKTIAVTNIAYTYSLGAAGTAGSIVTATNGGAGGATTITIGSAISANGGAGGANLTGSVTNKFTVGGAGGTAGSGGDIMVAGQPGEAGMTFSSATLASSGNGGTSLFGGGGKGQINATAVGSAGTGFGSGGGGAIAIAATANVGGVGTAGVIVVWEYK